MHSEKDPQTRGKKKRISERDYKLKAQHILHQRLKPTPGVDCCVKFGSLGGHLLNSEGVRREGQWTSHGTEVIRFFSLIIGVFRVILA